MNQYEALFAELAQRRLAAPAEARRGAINASKLGSGPGFSGLSQPSRPNLCRQRVSLRTVAQLAQKLVRGSSTDVAPSR